MRSFTETVWDGSAEASSTAHHPLQAQAPFNLSVMACHSLKRTQADGPSMPVREFNLIALDQKKKGTDTPCVRDNYLLYASNAVRATGELSTRSSTHAANSLTAKIEGNAHFVLPYDTVLCVILGILLFFVAIN